jgi:hypothetical protein
MVWPRKQTLCAILGSYLPSNIYNFIIDGGAAITQSYLEQDLHRRRLSFLRGWVPVRGEAQINERARREGCGRQDRNISAQEINGDEEAINQAEKGQQKLKASLDSHQRHPRRTHP